VSDPVILAPGLRRSIDEAVAAVKPQQKGRVGATVTLTGIEFGVGYKPTPKLDVGAYVGKPWGKGWNAGARIGLDF
jgi:hypothetical protein